MSDFDPGRFAKAWISDWTKLDLNSILAHYAGECTFRSPVAFQAIGRSSIVGRDDLENYWRTSTKRIVSIEFEFDYHAWDPKRRTLVIVYTANVNGSRRRATEISTFNAEGFIVDGEAMYGATIE
jgi:hypothetical protein